MKRVLKAPSPSILLPRLNLRLFILAVGLALSVGSAFAQPTIGTMNPQNAVAGSAGFTLTLNTSNVVLGAGPPRIFFGAGNALLTTGSGQVWLGTVTAAMITTAGTVPVTIQDINGTSAPVNFFITGPPAITGFNPVSLTQGSTHSLDILGSNFAPGDIVFWDSTSLSPSAPVQPGDIQVLVSSNQTTTGVHNVSVQPQVGAASTVKTITVNPAPTLTSLSQNVSTAGAAGFTLLLNGTSFVQGMTVDWIDNSTTSLTVLTPFNIGANQMSVTIPSTLIQSPTTGSVTVVTPDGLKTGSLGYTVQAAPTISTLNPTNVTAGHPAFSLAVSGNFQANATVRWNGSNRATTPVNLGQSTATILSTDLQTAGTALVTVITPDGVSSNSLLFTINAAPSITGFSPIFRTAGLGTFTLTINGSGFSAADTVNWNNPTSPLNITNATPNQLQVTVPGFLTTNPGANTIFVISSDNVSSPGAPFNVNPQPTLNNISPTSHTATFGSFTVTLNGSNFFSGDTVVWGNGSTPTTLAIGTLSANQITATVPAALIATAGGASVAIVTADNFSPPSQAQGFTILPIPSLSSLTPSSIAAGSPSFTLTVGGANFVSGDIVRWNGSNLPTAFVDAAHLTATIPNIDLQTPATVPISVLTFDGLASSNSISFTVSKFNSTGTLSASPTGPVNFGTPVTLTATFTGISTTLVPTGTVTFTDVTSNVTLGSAGLNSSGVATLTTSAILPGTKTLAANWSGDVDFNPPGTAPTTTLTVNPADPTISLTPNPTSVPLGTGAGSTVTYSVTVTGGPANAAPAGTITIRDGGQNALVSAGSGTCPGGFNLTALSGNTSSGSCTMIYDGSTVDRTVPPPQHSMAANYSPTGASVGVLNGGLSPAQLVNVTAGTPTTLTPSANPPSPLVVGQQTTLSVTVNGFSPQTAFNTLSGTVNFFDGTTQLNVSPIPLGVNSSNVGTASLAGQTFPTGNHAITAQFSGSALYTAVTSSVLNLVVGQASTTTVLLTNDATFGAGDILEAFVSVTGNSSARPTGTITFQNNGVTLGTATLTGGAAFYNLTTALPPGSYPNITAVYGGDAGDLGSTSPAQHITVNQNTTTGTLVTNPAGTAAFGQSVTLTATFAPSNQGEVVWTFQGTNFTDGGSLAGNFTYNAATGAFSGWDFTVSGGDTVNFPQYHYTPSTSFFSPTSAGLSFGRNNGNLFILFSFASPLTSAGGTVNLGPPSSECVPEGSGCSVSRNLTGAASGVSFVPSPSVFPTGTVTFTDTTSNVTLGQAALNNAGVAALTTSAILPGAAKTLTATWPGDTNYTPPVPAPTASLTVSTSTPIVTMSPAPSSVPMGTGLANTVTYSMTVTGGPANVQPTGTITMLDGSAQLSAGSGTCAGGVTLLPVSGNTSSVSCTVVYDGSTQDRSTGAQLMSAAYTPTGVSAAVLTSATSAQQTVTVTPATAIVATPVATPTTGSLPLVPGQQAVISVTVTGLQPGTAFNALTGSVTFFDGGTQLNASPIPLNVTGNVGTASLPAQAFTAGQHNITAQYSGSTAGNPGYAGTTSTALTLTVGKANTATTLTAATSSETFGNGDLLTATVAVTGNAVGTPTGTVSFKASNQTFGTGTLALVGGVATATYNLTTALPPNSYSITAVYNGDTNDNGSTSNAVAVTINSAPVISTISPTFATAGSQGLTLTVNGSSFIGATVNWNGAARTTTVNGNGTQATALIATADLVTAGTAAVTVVSSDNVISNSVNFTINPPPTITALSVTSATAGSAGFTLTVTGTNFFSGMTATFNGVSRPASTVNSNSLTFAVSSADLAQAVVAPITVVTSDGIASNSVNFTVTGAPVITALTPSQRTVGTAGFTLTVTGTGFVSGTVVKWNGSARQTAFGSSTQLTAAISSADLTQVSVVNVTAVTPSAASSASFPFNVVGPSVISTLSPTTHTAGSAGFTLTVTGTNLTSNTVVAWNGSPRPTSLLSANAVTATISAADLIQAGSANITAVNDGVPSNTLVFNILAAPTISGLSPGFRMVGSAGFTMTVNGGNFTGGMTATFNGSVRTPIAIAVNQLTFGVTTADLAQANPAVPVTVVTADGVASNTVNFTISSGQTITSLSTTSRTAGSAGFTLTVNGTGFTGTMTVDWNGSPRPTSFISAGQLAASITAADLAQPHPAVPITVVTADLSVISNAVNFTVAAAPTITSLTTPLGTSFRTAGSAQFTLTVNGANFVPSMTANFNGSGRPATLLSSGQVSFTVTAADLAQPSPGIATSVTTPDSITSNSVNFVVNPPPTVTGLTPSVRTAGSSGFTLTVAGTNFSAGATVNFNGAGRQTSVVSSTQATALISAGDVFAANTVPITVVTGDLVPSNASTFTINPQPSVTSISPAVRTAGSPAFVLTVIGSNFTNGTTVTWQGAGQPTTFVSATQLTASIPASLVTAVGVVAINVLTSDGVIPESGTNLQIVAAPTITNLNPSAATAGGPGFILTITGTNFVSQGAGGTSQALFGGNQVVTTVNSATSLRAAIPATLLTTGPAAVQVAGPGGVLSNSINFTVNGPLTITGGPGTLNFTAGSAYLGHNSAGGGTPPYSWSVIGLPGGFGINSSTGDITGNPSTSGSLSITVTVTDAAGASVSARYGGTNGGGGGTPPVVFTTASLPAGTVGVPYLAGIGASGGTGTITFSVNGGNLPDGIGMSNSGVLSGTPGTPGTFGFSVTATDSTGVSVGSGFSILINPAQLTVTGTNPADTIVGASFSFSFGATGGVKPYRFSVNGSIPDGTSTLGQTISGTLTSAGTFGFTIAVTDNAGTVASRSFSVTVAPVTLAVVGGALPDAQVGVVYSANVGAKGGTPPYTFSGSAPDGLGVGPDGSVTGTPTTAGQFSVSVSVSDKVGGKAVGSYSLNIIPAPLTITTTGLSDGTVNAAYSGGVAAAGGVKPYTFSFGGTPDGVGGNSDGSLTGTPTTSGSFAISATVKDATGKTATKLFSITIAPATLVLTLSAGNGTVGTAYSGSASATGGVKPYSFAATGLPAGVGISSSTGALSGTPSAAGTTTIAVTVTDAAGKTAGSSVQVTIALPAAPPVGFTGVSGTGTPGGQQTVGITISNPYPVDMNVTLALTFAPDAGPDDPTVAFSSGGRTAHLIIPAGATVSLASVGVQTGTVAGLITITAQLLVGTTDITPSPAPSTTIRINAAPPTITSATATRNASGFTVVVIGFVPDREIISVMFTFNAAPGSTLQTTSLTIPVDAVFGPWFSGPGVAFGSQFTFTQPFSVQGNTQSIVSVTITLVNKLGNSASVTVNLQ